MNTLCSFLSWKPQVQLSLEGRGLPQAGAKPPCPDRSSRWSCATGPFCLLALQGNGSYWALFFPRSYVPFLARKCVPHLLPTFRYLLRGAVAIQHSYYPKKVSFRLRAWKLPWGAASASDWSCKGYWCAPWVLCSLQSLFWAAACPFFRGEKGTGYQHPYLRIVSKVFPSSLWACLQEMVRAHSEVLWYTVYSVQGV